MQSIREVRHKVCTLEIWCEVFGGTKKNFTNANARELNGIMPAMNGWRNAKVYVDLEIYTGSKEPLSGSEKFRRT